MEDNSNGTDYIDHLQDELLDELFSVYCAENADDVNGSNGSKIINGSEKSSNCNDKSVIYENKEMYSIQGELIGYIPANRFNWYIRKGLCTQLNDNAIKINFEPNYKNKTNIVENESRSGKHNRCVVCGSCENLKKFRVIPKNIKKLLPDEYKVRISNDIIVLCASDEMDSDYITNQFKNELFYDYKIDVNNFKHDNNGQSLYLAAKKIKKDNYAFKNCYTLKSVEAILNKKNISPADIDNVIVEHEKFNYLGFKFPEEMLVDKIKKENSVSELIIKFKKNFVDNLEPKYLENDFWNSE